MNDYIDIRPHAVYKPKLFIDGNQWCALYGENLMEGIAGFGDTPSDAIINFNNEFTLLKPPTELLRSEHEQV